MNDSVSIPPETLRDFCRSWQIVELALFGSVLRDDFGPDSDVDVLVSFAEGAGHSLFELDDMESELKEIFGREVDLVSRRGIESSPNYLRWNAILGVGRDRLWIVTVHRLRHRPPLMSLLACILQRPFGHACMLCPGEPAGSLVWPD